MKLNLKFTKTLRLQSLAEFQQNCTMKLLIRNLALIYTYPKITNSWLEFEMIQIVIASFRSISIDVPSMVTVAQKKFCAHTDFKELEGTLISTGLVLWCVGCFATSVTH